MSESATFTQNRGLLSRASSLFSGLFGRQRVVLPIETDVKVVAPVEAPIEASYVEVIPPTPTREFAVQGTLSLTPTQDYASVVKAMPTLPAKSPPRIKGTIKTKRSNAKPRKAHRHCKRWTVAEINRLQNLMVDPSIPGKTLALRAYNISNIMGRTRSSIENQIANHRLTWG